MAKKKYSFGSMLFFGAATAALAGYAAYKHHNELEKVVNDIASELEAQEAEDFFEADLPEEDDKIVHIVPNAAEEKEAEDEDFVDDADGELDHPDPEE